VCLFYGCGLNGLRFLAVHGGIPDLRSNDLAVPKSGSFAEVLSRALLGIYTLLLSHAERPGATDSFACF